MMSEARRVLVTGPTGFIGGHLVRRLVGEGFEVHAIVRPRSVDCIDGVTVHVHDGSTAGAVAILEAVAPDIVYHLASLFLSTHTEGDVEALVNSNVLFGTQLLEAMKLAGCTRLVNAGTGWQHFSGPDYDPVNLYAATKQAFEDIALFYVALGISTVTLSLYDSYGPDDPRPKILPLLIRSAFGERSLELSAGEQLLHIVYIDDITNAFMLAGELLNRSQSPMCARYAVAADTPVSLRELVAAVEHAAGRRIDAHWGARPYRSREVMTPWVGERLPGWAPQIALDEGVHRVIAAMGYL